MSAEVLRRAAALMRERAESATPGPWEVAKEGGFVPEWAIWMPDAGCDKAMVDNPYDAEHIASWHPAVALAVADWLDEVADIRRLIAGLAERAQSDPLDGSSCFLNMEKKALKVAHAYLGGAK